MSLKQSLSNPATSAPIKESLPDCWRRERDRHCLRIERNSGEDFVFPYQQFLGAHHVRSSNPETLKISFSTHVVTLSGRNLSEISIALEELAIAWIKPIPIRFQELAAIDGALVTDIEVNATE